MDPEQAEERPSSRNIPLPLQRVVRQPCGFGCVLCGLPLYEYEHMEGWANVQRHVADEITLLCDQHHRERTGGLLPIERVREANKEPFNLRGGASKPYDLHFSGVEAEIVIGSNRFTARDQGYGTILVALSIDDGPLLGFILGDGHLLLNVATYDEFNRLILQIKNNQLWYSTEPWDIHLVGTTLTIREAARKVLIEIAFEPPNRVVVNRGRFLRNGVEVLIRPRNLLITNNAGVISGSQARDVPCGISIGPHLRPLPSMIRIESISRYLGDRRHALEWERECFQAG